VKLTNGRTVQKHISAVRGTADNPMTKDEVEIKAHELFSTVLGHNNSSALVRLIWEIETKTTLNSIWKLLSTKPINSN
jgi:hypothetical protein